MSDIKDSERRIEAFNKMDKNTEVKRRVAIAAGAAGVVGVVSTTLHQWRPKEPDITITSKVYSPRETGTEILPGGINFIIRNSGERNAVITGIHIVIEDYANLETCIYSDRGGISPELCHDIDLPVPATPGTQLDSDFRWECRTDAAESFDIRFGLPENERRTETAIGGMHLYRIYITFSQDDRSEIDVGRFIVATPLDNILGIYAQSEIVYIGKGKSNVDKMTRDEWAREAAHYDVLRESAPECFDSNDSALRRVITYDSVMSQTMEDAITKILSETHIYTPLPYDTSTPDLKLYECDETSTPG
ncbi:hypothetical protein [Actinomyces bowdenii]|uniref:Uncharacterized protein n=1 Tax=Actinomyces bowdenii TaxID=131109 RepID=A0A3P1UYY8_9ACTO|nr:hypothetical protein [Actinomyces bowdenii]RRD27234.1 hypothetical protein EII10_09715 [Actinomyces bowdenii]